MKKKSQDGTSESHFMQAKKDKWYEQWHCHIKSSHKNEYVSANDYYKCCCDTSTLNNFLVDKLMSFYTCTTTENRQSDSNALRIPRKHKTIKQASRHFELIVETHG